MILASEDTDMSRPELVDDMIGLIYSAAIDPNDWPTALRAIEDCTGSAGAVIDFIPTGAEPPMTLAGRFTEEQCRTYATDYQHQCRRIATALNRPEQPVHFDAMIMSEAEMDRDPVYNWLQSHGLRYFIGGSLPQVGNHKIYASLQRTRAQGHVQRPDIELFQIAKQHLSRAILIAEKLENVMLRQALTENYLNQLAHGFFLLKPNGQLVWANETAEALLRAGDILSTRGGILRAVHPACRSQLEKALACATGNETFDHNQNVRLFSTQGCEELAGICMPPVRNEAAPFLFGQGIVLIVFNPSKPPSARYSVLKDIYGLTRAEARVANWLTTNADPNHAIASLGITQHTLKSHIKAIFRKMDVHRQSDIVRIVVGLSLGRSHPPNRG